MKVTERLSFREARDRYNAAHPRRSYASVVTGSRPNRPPDQAPNGNIHQLIALLQSFGLRFVASNGESPVNVPTTPQQATPASSNTATQTSPPGAEVVNPDQEGWTLVRGRRGAGPSRSSGPSGIPSAEAENLTPPTQPPSVPPRSAAQNGREASHWTTKEMRLSGSGRTRLVEARHSTGADTVPQTTGRPSPETSSAARSSPMGPPPPPPRRPPAQPPPPPVTAVPEPRPLSETPPSAPIDPRPPAAPGRPAKRSLPWDGSPTDRGSPQTRNRFQPGATGRAHSADGRLRQGHPRVFYGDDGTSGEEEKF